MQAIFIIYGLRILILFNISNPNLNFKEVKISWNTEIYIFASDGT